MTILSKNVHGCPHLILAPMEGVGDPAFRRAMASIGGMDETCTEFLRVPTNAHVESLAKRYQSKETFPIPQAAQIMGSDPVLMAAMAKELEKRGAPRIDLNCGCPSNTVTGRGAGSSLLKEPAHLHQVAKAIVEVVSIPVTAKLRSGFHDTSLFKENLLAAQESGISFLTLHPRTKVDGYGPPAKWELIAEAKQLLQIPVVGNGDILNVKDAINMLKQTKCDALMIGRGSLVNPFIFQEIKAHFQQVSFSKQWSQVLTFIQTFVQHIPIDMTVRGQLNKIKQIFSFLFKANSQLLLNRQTVLTLQARDLNHYLEVVLPLYQMHFNSCDE